MIISTAVKTIGMAQKQLVTTVKTNQPTHTHLSKVLDNQVLLDLNPSECEADDQGH